MKKLFYSFLLASFLIGGGVAIAYNDGSAVNNKEASGGSAADPVRVYTLVRYPNTTDVGVALSAGDVVIWDCVSDDGVTVNLVTVAGSSDAVAGVVVSSTIPTADQANTAAGDIGRRNWGYIQTYGVNSTVNIISGPAVAGQSLIASDTARYATSGVTVQAATQKRTLGFAYDASSSGQSEAFIMTR